MIYTSYIWPLIVASILLTGIGFYIQRFSGSLAVLPLSITMWADTAWALLYALAISTVSFGPRLLLGNAAILAAQVVTFASFVGVLEYTGHREWLTRRRTILLLAISMTIVILAFTSPYHKLFRYDFQIDLSHHFSGLLYTTGPLFLLYPGYLLLIHLGSIVVLIATALQRKQDMINLLLLLLAILFPLSYSIIFLMGLSPVPGLDLSSTMLVFSGLFYIAALAGNRFLDVTYVARDLVMDHIADLVIVLDTRNHIIDLNYLAREALDLPAKGYAGIDPLKLPAPWPELFRRCAGTACLHQEVTIDKNNSSKIFELTVAPIQDYRLRLLGRVFLLHDITERKNIEEVLRESEEKFRTLVESTVIGMFIYDGEHFVVTNPAFEQVTGYSTSDLKDMDPLDIYHPLVREIIRERAAARLRGEPVVSHYDAMFMTHSGEEKWVDMSVSLITYHGKPASLGTFFDITERKQADLTLRHANEELADQLEKNQLLQEKLLEQAVRDPLTGLFNRRYLHETLEREIAGAERNGLPLSVIMLDLDHFKTFNDTYGHKAGDLILGSVGQILQKFTRRMDIACRFGGDEFVIIMPTTPTETACQRAETLRQTVADLSLDYDHKKLHLTLSAGVASFPMDGKSGDTIVQDADLALYAAKASGRNRVKLFNAH